MGLGKEKDESPLEYQIRICSEREQLGLTWTEVAHLLNEEIGDLDKDGNPINYGESKYRKWWYAFNEGMDYIRSLEAERNEAVKEYVGEQKKDFQILSGGGQASTIVTKLNEEQLKDPDYLLKIHGYDPNEWELTGAKSSAWNNKMDSELYSSRITVKPREGFNWNEDNIRKIFDRISVTIPNLSYEYAKFHSENKEDVEQNEMVVIGISDLHYGLLAKENLSEEYNMKIAKDRFNSIITDVIRRKCEQDTVEKVVLLLGNDFLNADNIQGTTSRHFTQQDQETNWFEIITSATEMLIEAIEKLRFFFPKVEVINVKGNHDEMSMFGIMQTLNAYYKDTISVTIDTGAKYRKYLRYGCNLVGMSHNEKINEVAKIMAAEAGKDWGETTYKMFLLGHLHTKRQLEDDHGVDIYGMSSVVGASDWTAGQGYCGTNKMSQTFILDKYRGLVEIINTIVEN